MIALRLADRIGLDEAERSTVYYTALLVNVGCHSDAHEQAKWFGDDIALKSTKYDHDFRSVRAAAATLSLVGSGNPPLHRFRVGLEFAVSGRRDLDGMVARHSAIAQALAERLGLPEEVQEAVGASYEQWDGKGWPGGLAGDRDPDRGAPGAVRGVRRGRAPARRRRSSASRWPSGAPGCSSIPALAAPCAPIPDEILGGLDSGRHLERGDRRRARPARHALRRRLRPGAARDRGLRRPQVAVHARACPRRGGARGRDRRAARPGGGRDARCCAAPASSTTSGGSASRTRSGTSRARSARASGSACGCTPI